VRPSIAAGSAEVHAMLTLYFTPGASSMAPHIALHEIGVPFGNHYISLAKNEHRTSAYLAINLEGKVPTLLIDAA
jgi:glutathione S-transferase